MDKANSEFAWKVKVELTGEEVGKLPVFITNAELYVTANSAKEACWLAERYLKGLQPMEVISVECWWAKNHEQKNTGCLSSENLRTEQ